MRAPCIQTQSAPILPHAVGRLALDRLSNRVRSADLAALDYWRGRTAFRKQTVWGHRGQSLEAYTRTRTCNSGHRNISVDTCRQRQELELHQNA